MRTRDFIAGLVFGAVVCGALLALFAWWLGRFPDAPGVLACVLATLAVSFWFFDPQQRPSRDGRTIVLTGQGSYARTYSPRITTRR